MFSPEQFYLSCIVALLVFVLLILFLNLYSRYHMIADIVNYLHARGIKSFPLTHKVLERYISENLLVGDLFFIIGTILFIFGFINKIFLALIFGLIIMLSSGTFITLIWLRKKHNLKHEKYYSITETFDIPTNKINDLIGDFSMIKTVQDLLKQEEILKKEEIEVIKKLETLMAPKDQQPVQQPSAIHEDTRFDTLKLAEVIHILKVTDDLLEKLPKEELEKFMNSDDFKIYSSVMSKIKR